MPTRAIERVRGRERACNGEAASATGETGKTTAPSAAGHDRGVETARAWKLDHGLGLFRGP